jgi:hypothetical protein
MRKNKIFVVATSVFILGCAILYLYILNIQIDTKYATRFSEVLEKGDIKVADKYFSQDTVIVCAGKSGIYRDLRKNVINKFQDKRKITVTTYGHGNDKFVNGIQEVGITAVITDELQKKKWGDFPFSIYIEKVSICSFNVKTVKFENEFLEELFFGLTNNS